ncbi:MAG: hypothetical protein ABW133_06570 [Polyangiaceae bacterium]
MTVKWKVFIGASLSAWGISLASPGFAQDSPPSGGTAPAQGQAPNEPSSTPPSESPAPPAAPSEGAETRPAETPAPSAEPPPAETAPPPVVTPAVVDDGPPVVDELPRKIGDKLAPLWFTAGAGYGYASLKLPSLNNDSISGPYLELTAGTELDSRLRVSIGISNMETKIRRSSNGKWEEGDYVRKLATTSSSQGGLHSQADPIEPVTLQGGGAAVQRTMHTTAVGPRVDYFPLGSQGPYVGVTTALAILSGIDSRVGFNAGARLGGEWRPFQELAFSIEAGAQGHFYEGAHATIPYGLARVSLLLDPAELSSSAAAKRQQMGTPPGSQRTLPTSTTPR